MGAPGQSPFDGLTIGATAIVGYLPGDPDFNGAALTDDPVYPPDPSTMPTSALLNTYSKLHESTSRMIASASFGVSAGATPAFVYWSTAANTITSNPFVFYRQGTGHYQVGWTANMFPASRAPKPYLNSAGTTVSAMPDQTIRAQYMAVGPTAGMQGVEFWTTSGGTATDLNCCIDLF